MPCVVSELIYIINSYLIVLIRANVARHMLEYIFQVPLGAETPVWAQIFLPPNWNGFLIVGNQFAYLFFGARGGAPPLKLGHAQESHVHIR